MGPIAECQHTTVIEGAKDSESLKKLDLHQGGLLEAAAVANGSSGWEIHMESFQWRRSYWILNKFSLNNSFKSKLKKL
jgi:hypothetical protein